MIELLGVGGEARLLVAHKFARADLCVYPLDVEALGLVASTNACYSSRTCC